MKRNENNRGMTLVEVIVAVAIIGVCSVMMLSAFGGAGRLMSRGKDIGQSGNIAYEAVEKDAGSSAASVRFTAGTETLTVNGQIRRQAQSYGDPQSQVQFWLFVPPQIAMEGKS
ncbi:MAG: type II secretion system protein [Clostridiales bacterium]